MDTTPDDAVKRMTDQLESLAKEPGFGKADRVFYERLAVRYVNGIVPYINGRDSILADRLEKLEAQLAAQQQQITTVQNVANQAKAATQPKPPAKTTSPPAPPRQNFLSRLTRRIFG